MGQMDQHITSENTFDTFPLYWKAVAFFSAALIESPGEYFLNEK